MAVPAGEGQGRHGTDFKHGTAGKARPIAWEMHNTGLFDD